LTEVAVRLALVTEGMIHRSLDDLMDWVAATLDLHEQAGIAGEDLVGLSVGGMLAAEVAAAGGTT
jgi:thioesterase domain-containing protein